MDVVGYLIFGAILLCGLLYYLFSKQSFPSDPQEYANKARNNVGSSVMGSYLEQFRTDTATKTIQARTQLAAALGELHKQEGKARIAKEENDMAVVRNRLADELKVLQHNNATSVLEKSTEVFLSPVAYEQQRLKEHETNETIRLKEAESEIEVTGKKALADHEVDIDFKKKMNTLVAITRYQHLQFDAFDEVRGRLITLVQEAHRIENSNMDVYLKGEIMGKMQQAIAAYQEVFDDYRRRIMEGGDGEAIRQIDSITKLAGSGEFGDSSAPFKIHSPQSGDRD